MVSLISSFGGRILRSSLSLGSTRQMSSSAGAPLLVSPGELSDLSKTGVAVLDASWHMPNSPRNARDEYIKKRIPNAQFLNLDEVASPHELGLKHMMPSPQVFADACSSWGITPSTHVVLYDTHGVFSSPRALFMFRAFGHTNSSILNGGLPLWESEGLPIETGPPKTVKEKAEYPPPTFDDKTIRSYKQIARNAARNPTEPLAELVLDARSRGRWLGSDPEPRPGLASGHIPFSASLPFNTFLQTHQAPNSSSSYMTLLLPREIKQKLIDTVGPQRAEKILQGERSVVTSCGSGMTAAILWLGLKTLGVDKIGLYDESWTGYAMREASIIDTGEH